MTQEDRNALMKSEQDVVTFPRKPQHIVELTASIRRLARAQAILWHDTPIAERRKILDRVDAESEAMKDVK